MKTPASTAVVEKVSGFLADRFSRRGFFARTALVGSAVAVNPVTYALRPTTAYAAVCNCNGSACECGSLCCDGYTEFCCTLFGDNRCPPGTLLGGWWKADGTAFCNGPRYYMDCNAPCNGCGCGANGICSGACSGTGCGCAQGSCANRKAGCTQFRYGQCNQNVPCLGPIVCRVVTCVPPWSLDPSCTTTVRVDQNTASHDRACLHKVVGSLDSVTEAEGGIRVRGWALDFDTQGPVTVQAFVDGAYVAAAVADRSRPDVGAAYRGWGDNHGFEFTVPITPGGVRQLCLYALNAGAGSGSAPLGCRSVKLTNPFGSLDEVSTGPGTVTVRGWVIDPDTTGPIKVRVYADGTYKGEFTANRSRPDVGRIYPAYGNAHGFEATVPVSGGRRQICVYGINVGDGSTNTTIGCRTVEVGAPFGSVDSVVAVPAGVRVTGWVIDPDTVGPVKIHIYVDGAFRGEFTADRPRPDVGAAHPAYGPNHGFVENVLTAPGVRRIDVYAINVGGGSNPLVASRSVNVLSGNPFGSFDRVIPGPGTARIQGWVIDPDSLGPTKLHVYVDGRFRAELSADEPRPDVAAQYPGHGTARGFDDVIAVAAGLHQIDVYGINTGAGTANPLIGRRSVQIGGDPFGSLDGAVGGAGSITVRGWAIDPDTAAPITVHVHLDGVPVASATADRPRSDVGAAYPAYGPDHGFELTVPAAPGSRRVLVYGINTLTGAANPLLGARTVTVS